MDEVVCQGIRELTEYSRIFLNVGIGLGGVTAFLALLVTGVKTLENQWSQEFRKLYDEFWQRPVLNKARNLIIYKDEYDDILKPALNYVDMVRQERKKLDSDNAAIPIESSEKKFSSATMIKYSLPEDFSFTADHKEAIACIDQFMSKIVQVGFLPKVLFWDRKSKDIRRLFYSYWLDEISNRIELVQYIKEDWKSLQNFIEDDFEVPFIRDMKQENRAKRKIAKRR